MGSRKVLGICCAGYGIGQILFALMKSLFTILCARMIAGFFVGGIMVSFLTYIIHECQGAERGEYLALNATFASVFGAFGYMIGGFVGVYSILSAFILQSVTLIVCGIGFYFILHDDVLEAKQPFNFVKDANPFQAFYDSKYFMNGMLAILFLTVFLTSTASTAYDQCFNYYIKDFFNLNSSYNGMIKAIVGFISLLANTTICVWLMKKTDVRKSILFVLGFGAFFLNGITFFNEIMVFAIMNLCFFVINAIYVPLLQDLCARKSEKKDSDMVMGFYNAMKSLGMIAGALFAGFLYEVGVKLSFLFAMVLFVFCTILMFVYYKKSKPTVR